MCHFLLVINTNVRPLLHRFQVMADYSLSTWSRFKLTPYLGGYPDIRYGYPDILYDFRNLTLKTARSYIHSSGQNIGT